MDDNNQDLMISYTYDYKQFKKEHLHPTTLLSILCCNIIPITVILIVELVLLLISLEVGFTFMRVFWMILLAGIYTLFILIYTPAYLILTNIQWKRINKLPLERKWLFTEKGITIDRLYIKTYYPWKIFQSIDIGKKAIFFRTTNNNIINLGIETLPIRHLHEEQFEELQIIFRNYLGESKIQFGVDKEKLIFRSI